jgi:hypothetical protein
MNTQMIPLTVANTLDQTSKQRIEIPSGITVKQAVVQSKNAPQGEFDIFNGNGQVISGRSVDDFKDSTIYVGVKKVAGGAIHFDDDWDEGIDLDDIDKIPEKTITIVMPDTRRLEIKPNGNETIIALAERNNLRPRDGSAIEIYDDNGDCVSNRTASDMIGRSFRLQNRALVSGGSGIPRNRLDELRIDYPSIKPVRQHSSNGQVSMISLQFPSNGRTSSGIWRIAIHCPNAGNGLPHSYILNHGDNIRPGVSVFVNGSAPTNGYGAGSSKTIPGTNIPAHWICHGNIMSVLDHLGSDPIKRLGAYINHIQNLLNS